MNKDLKFNTQIDNVHKNKTLSYILPCMKDYDTFSYFLNNVNVAGVAIGDCIHDVNFASNNNLYIAVNISNRTNIKYNTIINSDYDFRIFTNLMEEVRSFSWFVEDYPMIVNNAMDQFHTIVCKLPEKFTNIKEKFLSGKYSELYEKHEILKYFNKTYIRDDTEHYTLPYLVLTKHEKYRKHFAEIIKNDFGTDVDINENYELDYPPIKQNEIINYDYYLTKYEKTLSGSS